MSDVSTVESGAETTPTGVTRAATKLLLYGGIVAVALYAIGDLVAGLLYDGYSFKDRR